MRDFGADAAFPRRRARRQAGRARARAPRSCTTRSGASPSWTRVVHAAARRGCARPSGAAGARRSASCDARLTLHEMRLIKIARRDRGAAPGRRHHRRGAHRRDARRARRRPASTRSRRSSTTPSGGAAAPAPATRRSSAAAPTPPSSTTSRTARRCERGQLLLVDAGCEVDGYTADVTRTSPIGAPLLAGRSGASTRWCWRRRSRRSRRSSRAPPSTAIHEQVVERLTRALVALGLLAGEVPALIEEGAYSAFYMHRTSHWLGMDVHDVGFYSEEGAARPLEPGHGADHRARPLRRRGRAGAARVPRHRRPHRGRHPGHRERPREPDRRRSPSPSPSSKRSRRREIATARAGRIRTETRRRRRSRRRRRCGCR